LRIVYSVASGAFGGVSSKMVWLFWSVFSLATTIYFIVCLVRAWKDENRVIEPLADLTRWLNEKIEPRK
jgi:type IV secretory pathway TrbL component